MTKNNNIKFSEKVLRKSEIDYSMILVPEKDFPDFMSGYEGPVVVIDYRTGKMVDANMRVPNNCMKTLRITGLSELWKHNNRNIILKADDIIGIYADKESKTIVLDFEYEIEEYGKNNRNVFKRKLVLSEIRYGLLMSNDYIKFLPKVGDTVIIKDKKTGEDFVGRMDQNYFGIYRILGLSAFMKRYSAEAGDYITLEIDSEKITAEIEKIQKRTVVVGRR